MYIEPNTTIRILKNVPLDNTYDHTIYFSDATSQANYLLSKTKYSLIQNTYQRVKRGVARVGIKADNLYDCNYMMFQNINFGSKWFYAFITGVEYVNNECSEVSFELDVMQTWAFDYNPDYCFVEREHTLTDAIGEHIEPEPVEHGEYVFNNYAAVTNMRDMVVAIAIVDKDATPGGTLYDGIYGGAQIWVYNSTDTEGINSTVNTYMKKPDAIIAMYMFPTLFIGGGIPENHRLSYGQGASKKIVVADAITVNDTLDGYKPVNRKLYTYPYSFWHVDNACGGELTLRYEFFNERNPVMEITGTVTQPVVAVLRPCSYKGAPPYSELGGYTTLNTESLELANYPMCSWSVDTYKSWLAQNSVPLAMNTMATLSSMASPMGMTISEGNAISLISNTLTQGYKASIAADMCKGSQNNGGANVSNGVQQFYGGRCSVTKEYAMMIDDFFTRFGYAVKRNKVPNRDSRPHWNYVKTIGCTITGSIPADDARKICRIYDNGITFWKNGDEIGDYSLDNSPS